MTIHQYNKEIANPTSVYSKTHRSFLKEREKALRAKVDSLMKSAEEGITRKFSRIANETRDETREEARITVMHAVQESGFEAYDEQVRINETDWPADREKPDRSASEQWGKRKMRKGCCDKSIKRRHVHKQSMLEITKQEDNTGVLRGVRLERARNAAAARLQELQDAVRKDAIVARVGDAGRVLDVIDMLEQSGFSLNHTKTGDASTAPRQAQHMHKIQRRSRSTPTMMTARSTYRIQAAFLKAGPLRKQRQVLRRNLKRQQSLVQLGRTPILTLHPQ